MGKKQTCPYCKEKVDLKRMFPSPYPFHIVISESAQLTETRAQGYKHFLLISAEHETYPANKDYNANICWDFSIL